MNQFFYTGQIRRFLTQFVRAMSGFQVEISKNALGISTYQQIPVIYGDSSRQVAQILKGNTENMMSSVPMMSIYITSLTYDRPRILNPYHVDKIHIKERQYNEETNEWSENRGDSFTVERLMPVPYKLGLKLDIWSSSTDQKLQIVEQISTLFNPELEIQNTDNFLDWTSLSAIFLNDIVWSSRNVPMGADDSIDVATMTFELPIWLSTPAKVKKLGVIQKVISDIYDVTGATDNLTPGSLSPDILDLANSTVLTRRFLTPMGVHLLYLGNTLRLLKESDAVLTNNTINTPINDPNVRPTSWQELMNMYGELVNGVTQIRLFQEGTGTEVIGTVAYHPTDPLLLLFSPFLDTLPVNSVPAINAIIDPYTVNITATILTPTVGYRFLILDDIGSILNSEGALAWRGSDNVDLVAKKNDIIEYNGTHWVVSFVAAEATDIKYVTNATTGSQYKLESNQWVKSVEGHYINGNWRIVL